MNTLLLILLYAASLFSLIVGFVVALRDVRRAENVSFAVLSVGVACWDIGIANFLHTSSDTAALYWAKFYYVAPIVIVLSSLYFSQQFLYKKELPKYINGMLVGLGAVFSFLLIVDPTFITARLVHRTYGKQILFNSVEYGIYSFLLLVCFAVAIGIIIVKLRHIRYILARQQANIFLNGYTISVVLGVYFNLILPALGSYRWIMVGPMASTVLLFFISYGIIRHRLFDLRTVILRAAAYGLSSMGLSILYIAPALYLVSIVIMGFPFVLGKFIFGTIVGTIAATYYGSVRRKFDHQTEKIFYRDAYDSIEVIGRLNRILVATANLNKMLQNSINLLMGSFKTEFCTFILEDNRTRGYRAIGSMPHKIRPSDLKKLDSLFKSINQTVIITDYIDPLHQDIKNILATNDIAAVINLRSEIDRDQRLGYMLLGYKKSGNAFNTQDFNALEAIANVIVIAIQNALHFEEIQSFNETLQRKVDEATAKYRRTNAKLKALDETKDDFISMASHQLRTPLTSVKGYLSMVLEGDAGTITPLQRKMLDQAFVSSQRMVFLIADLLNVSRLKTGKFIIEPSSVNLSKTVNDEINQLKETAKGRSLNLEYERPADFPVLMIDETKIRQVIMNFIDNAIYYTPAGGTIRVELADRADTVELRVVDTGIGVPRNEQPHLFTKFYRAGNARQTRPDGTGLGLFMAKKVIIAQGGAVIFESQEGKGSCFGFILPKNKLLVSEPAPVASKPSKVTASPR